MAMLYVAEGTALVLYRVDESGQNLARSAAVMLPAAVQYVWPHPTEPMLFAAFSNRSSSAGKHGVAALRIDRRTGRLALIGGPTRLGTRPIHITVSPDGRFLLAAYNDPSALTVHRLGSDGAVGPAIGQDAAIDAGIFAHQVRVAPDGRTVVLSARGNDAAGTSPEDPGAIKVFALDEGELRPTQSIAAGEGIGPRHVDFHPTQPWVYAVMERGNQLRVYALADATLTELPAFTRSTLADPGTVAPGQAAAAVHVHPDGRTVYVSNRTADGTGEDSLVAFAIDPATGEPTPIQTIATHSCHCRTFSIHPDGRALVAASTNHTATVPAALSVFRIADDGRLTFGAKSDSPPGSPAMFWCGFVA